MTLSLNGTDLITSANIASAGVTVGKLSQRFQLGETIQANTGRTLYEFGSVPSWCKRVLIAYDHIKLSSTSNILIQLKTATSTVTSGYVSNSEVIAGGVTSAVVTATNGIIIHAGATTNLECGQLLLTNIANNLWVANGQHTYDANLTYAAWENSTVNLGAALVGFRITSVSGTDTFGGTGGYISVYYQ